MKTRLNRTDKNKTGSKPIRLLPYEKVILKANTPYSTLHLRNIFKCDPRGVFLGLQFARKCIV